MSVAVQATSRHTFSQRGDIATPPCDDHLPGEVRSPLGEQLLYLLHSARLAPCT